MDENITANDQTGTPVLSICVPTWRDDAGALLASLTRLDGINTCEVLVYDDGSADPAVTASITASINAIPAPARLITAAKNHGRSHGRNRLEHHASAPWLLLLDADMLPDQDTFLSSYLARIDAQADAPALIAGGFSLDQVEPNQAQALHAAQSRRSECLPATIRQREPGRYVFTSNILVHRDILKQVPFDDAFSGWGWEDVDWGLRVAERFTVGHIDNTATHLGLDETANLMRKYETSGANFARLISRHPEATRDMALLKAATRLKTLPGRSFAYRFSNLLARDPLGMTPMPVRLFALKLFRAAIYAEALPS